MEYPSIPQIHISEIDTAKRQVETAIVLYFQNGDPVSIHTLTAAAYTILEKLGKTRGIKPIIKDTEMIRKEKRGEWFELINNPQNFFKHGHDRKRGHPNPDQSYMFRPATTDFLIWDACRMYAIITTEIPEFVFSFMCWFYIHYPDMLPDPEAEKLSSMHTSFDTHDRSVFFQQMSSTMIDMALDGFSVFV